MTCVVFHRPSMMTAIRLAKWQQPYWTGLRWVLTLMQLLLTGPRQTVPKIRTACFDLEWSDSQVITVSQMTAVSIFFPQMSDVSVLILAMHLFRLPYQSLWRPVWVSKSYSNLAQRCGCASGCVYVLNDKQDEGGHNMAQWNLWEPAERSALHFIFFFFFWLRSGTCCLWVGSKKKHRRNSQS